MKYQIYLNKSTTEFFNKWSEQTGKKSATLIKELVESFVLLSKPMEKEILKEVKPNE